MPTVVVTYPLELQTTLDRVLVDLGPTVVNDLVTFWLRDRKTVQINTDIQQLLSGTADPTTKARVRVLLGL